MTGDKNSCWPGTSSGGGRLDDRGTDSAEATVIGGSVLRRRVGGTFGSCLRCFTAEAPVLNSQDDDIRGLFEAPMLASSSRIRSSTRRIWSSRLVGAGRSAG